MDRLGIARYMRAAYGSASRDGWAASLQILCVTGWPEHALDVLADSWFRPLCGEGWPQAPDKQKAPGLGTGGLLDAFGIMRGGWGI